MKNKTILYLDSKFAFGKYRGEMLSYVWRTNPNYVEWCKGNIPDIEFRNRLHPIQHKDKNDESWKKIDAKTLRSWTSGYLAWKNPSDFNTLIDFS